jgi:hypothetical protein
MSFKRPWILFLVSVPLFAGCGTSFYYAEFIYPSQIYVPADLYKIGIVNHATSPNDAAPVYNSSGEIVDYLKGLPLTTAAKVVEAIEKENKAMDRYEISQFDWDNALMPGAIKPGSEITLAQADSICLWELVDGLIIAEGVYLTVDAKGQRAETDLVDSEGRIMRVPEFTLNTKLNLTMRWRFYDYVRKAFIDDYEETYDFTIQNIFYTEKEALEFSPGEVSLNELASIAAVDYYARIAPFWMEDFRLYYQTGNEAMYRIATELEFDGDWKKAGLAWKELIDDPDEKVAHRARFNMAVANEMLGMPVDAKIWLQQAEEIKVTKDTGKYMERLEKQILLYEVVSRQLRIDEQL